MKTSKGLFGLFVLILLLSSGKSLAQQNLFYNHYFLNPYLYNPSYIATNGYSELFLNYRNQWSGVNGAPKTVTLNLGIPLNYRSGFGFMAYQDEAGILKTTTALLSYNYKIFLGKNYDVINQLSFGISAGVTISGLDASKADDQTDPVLTGQTTSMDGQFGVNYQFKNLKLSVAIPRLFQTYVASADGFNKPGIEPVKTTISSISYSFPIGQRISIDPYFFYRTYNNTAGQYEALAILRIDKIVWLGGSYRQNYGAAGMIGFNIKDKIKIGYAYEFASSQTSGLGSGSHELQLAIRIGKKTVSRPQPKVEEEIAPEEIAKEEVAPEVKQPVKEEPKPIIVEPVIAKEIPKTVEPTPVEEKPVTENAPVIKPVKSLDGKSLAPGHYVVVGAFQSIENAKNYARTLKKAGYPAEIAYHPEKGYYIVHMGNAPTLEESHQLRDKYRKMSHYSFRDTWILSID